MIALVTDAIGPYHRGGKEQRYVELARRLSARADVHVYTMKWWPGPPTRRHGAVTYHAIAPRLPLYSGPRRSIVQAMVFAACCLRLLFARFDVIEADHMPYIQLLPLKLVAALRRRRLVVTWHECWGPDYWRSYLGQPGRVGWLCESISMRLPDAIIAASPQTASRLREFTGDRVPIHVAPNGIDLEAIGRAEPSVQDADVVAVGRLLPHKRIDLLLDALAILRDAGRPATARVIGSGPQRGALQATADRLGLADFVDFRQDIETASDLYGAVKAARAAVFPSEREGFGIAVLEALACGVPVITTSAPDNLAQHLVARSSAGGTVCEPTAAGLAAAIDEVLESAPAPAERGPDRLPSCEREWLREYDWDAITDTVAAALS
jgi:glycosyltransferase involved in cell wall biosynthesis